MTWKSWFENKPGTKSGEGICRSGFAVSEPSRNFDWHPYLSSEHTTSSGESVDTFTDRRLKSGKIRKPRLPGRHEFQREAFQETQDLLVLNLMKK